MRSVSVAGLVLVLAVALAVPAEAQRGSGGGKHRAERGGGEKQGRFKEKCGMCHGSARGLAEKKLISYQGRLVGRYTGRDMTEFLPIHGRPSPDDTAHFLKVMRKFAPPAPVAR